MYLVGLALLFQIRKNLHQASSTYQSNGMLILSHDHRGPCPTSGFNCHFEKHLPMGTPVERLKGFVVNHFL